MKVTTIFLALLAISPMGAGCQASDGRPEGFPDPDIYVQRYVEGTDISVPGVAIALCPAASRWHGEVLEALMSLDLTEERLAHFGPSWHGAIGRCGFQPFREWYRRALLASSSIGVARRLARGLLVEGDPADVEVVVQFGLDPTRSEHARTAALMQVSLGKTVAQRRDLVLSLVSRGDVPREYVMRELGSLVVGPDVDRFARGVLDVVIANPAGENAAQLLSAIVREALGGGLSTATSRAVLTGLEGLEGANVPFELRETVARLAPLLRVRIG